MFFIKLLSYEIVDNCNHKQIRSFTLNLDNKFDRILMKLNKSIANGKYN